MEKLHVNKHMGGLLGYVLMMRGRNLRNIKDLQDLLLGLDAFLEGSSLAIPAHTLAQLEFRRCRTYNPTKSHLYVIGGTWQRKNKTMKKKQKKI